MGVVAFLDWTIHLALTAAQGEKLIAVWSLNEEIEKRDARIKPANVIIGMENEAVHVTTCTFGKDIAFVLAISISGEVYIWRITSTNESLVACLMVRAKVIGQGKKKGLVHPIITARLKS